MSSSIVLLLFFCDREKVFLYTDDIHWTQTSTYLLPVLWQHTTLITHHGNFGFCLCKVINKVSVTYALQLVPAPWQTRLTHHMSQSIQSPFDVAIVFDTSTIILKMIRNKEINTFILYFHYYGYCFCSSWNLFSFCGHIQLFVLPLHWTRWDQSAQ